MTSRYFKRRWEEAHPDREAWGASTWYFEVVADQILRQIEVYDAGQVLRYGPDRREDEYGFLATCGFANGEDWTPWAISALEFESVWCR